MFKDEAAILQAAAILAAAEHTAALAARDATVGTPMHRQMPHPRAKPVERLVATLQEMEAAGLIPSGLAPAAPRAQP